MIKISNRQDFAAGFLLIGFSALAYWFARTLPAGTAMDMGPGYFPRILAAVIFVLGVILVVKSASGEKRAFPTASPAQVLLVLSSIAAFAFTLERLGLVVAAFLLVLISSAAWRGQKWLSIAIFGMALVSFVILVFVVGLGITIRVWP